ncbi:unnamed protein product [Acanthosepion pharaonis]|uniref:Uncharacterized protein n=1 Tax=Acanthosepion pharaonis TaxID=158019 RepID=A0A812DBP1_ACAPH|nr:unnamed protein product [Sepia pharaonis]
MTGDQTEKFFCSTISGGSSSKDWQYFLRRRNNYRQETNITGRDTSIELMECCEESLRRDLHHCNVGGRHINLLFFFLLFSSFFSFYFFYLSFNLFFILSFSHSLSSSILSSTLSFSLSKIFLGFLFIFFPFLVLFFLILIFPIRKEFSFSFFVL